MSGKKSNPENMNHCSKKEEGVDIPFGPPPKEYSYLCSLCMCKMKVNEAIIDFEVEMAEYNGTYYEGYMPILVCPHCNRETFEFIRD